MRRTRGFTLTELLVVLGIIAVLISLLLPALSRARESGRLVVCLNNVRNINHAMLMYATDNNSCLPTCADPATCGGRAHRGTSPTSSSRVR